MIKNSMVYKTNSRLRSRYQEDYLTEKLFPIFKKFRVLLAYFFGSQVKGKIGPLSDVDIAVLWQETESMPMKKTLELQEAVMMRLKDYDRIEIGPLNNQALSFCYEVIKNGKCIYGKEEDRVPYEVYILNEYLDFLPLAEEYNREFRKAYR